MVLRNYSSFLRSPEASEDEAQKLRRIKELNYTE